MKKYFGKIVFLLAFFCVLSYGSIAVQAKTLQVKIGQSIKVSKAGAEYRTSDRKIASVSADGLVTGKSKGRVTISIIKSGKVTKKTVEVVANAKKPDLKVCADDIVVKKIGINLLEEEHPAEAPGDGETENADNGVGEAENTGDSEDAGGAEDTDNSESAGETEPTRYRYQVSIKLKNMSAYQAKKIIVKGCMDGQTVQFTISKLGTKESAQGDVEITSTLFREELEFTLTSIQVTSGKMIHTRNYQKGTMSYKYGTEDTTAPVISGFVGAGSYNDGIPYQTVYADTADDYNYLQYVKAVDDRDMKVNLTVDTSKVNFKKKGVYSIIYIAKDKAGNTAKKKAKIAVRVNDEYDRLADQVLRTIIQSNWSREKKAVAIYNYTRGHIAYSYNGNHSNWETAAKSGILYGRGDCYTYYAVARLLLSRAGIPNLEITRVRGGGLHWWNMVYVKSGFYHFDCTPRVTGGRFCLVTDSQLSYYSSHIGHNSHIWAYGKKPKSSTKVLYSIM